MLKRTVCALITDLFGLRLERLPLLLSFLILIASTNTHGIEYSSDAIPTAERFYTQVLTEEERGYLRQHPTLRISNEDDYPPFDFSVQGVPSGYSIDLLSLIQSRLNVEFEYVNGHSWNELLEMLKVGELDLVHTANKTEERKAYGIFSTPYKRYKNYFVTHRDNAEIRSVNDLNGRTVVVGRGWSQAAFLHEHYPNINLMVVDSMEEMLFAVSNKRAYATIGDTATVRYMQSRLDINDIKISGWFSEFDRESHRSFHFIARHSAPELISILNKALASVTVAEMESLRAKWFGDQGMRESGGSLSPYLTSEEMGYLEAKGAIRVCVDPDWMPFEGLDSHGQHIGMAADILRIVGERANITFDIIRTSSWSESIELAVNRGCDIYSLAMETPERKRYMDFTAPYISFPFVIVTSNDQIYVDGIEQILDESLATVKGYAYTEILRNRYPSLSLIEVNNVVDGLRLVESGEVFGMIGALPTVANGILNNGITNVKISGQFDDGWELAIGTRNDEPILYSIMSKAISAVSEREKHEVYNRWYSVRVQNGFNYAILIQLLLGVAAVVAIVLLWNRQLASARRKTQDALEQLQHAHELLEHKNQELSAVAVRDYLTQIFNRVKLDQVLLQEVERSCRYKHNFGLILLDIDLFKRVNDNYGHQMGDEVLIKVAQILMRHSRDVDIVGRWGGEEFMVICPETGLVGARTLAENLRQAVEIHEFPVGLPITISVGVSEFHPSESLYSVISSADAALYKAKSQGRNRVAIAD